MIPRHFQITIGFLLAAILIIGISLTRLPDQPAALQGVQAGPAAPLVGGKQERIRILVAYDDDQALRWRDADAFMPDDRGLRAREALRAVLAQYLQYPSPHPMGKGADIRDVYWIGDDTLVVDTTPQFADGHPSSILAEQLTLTSLIETVNSNVPGIARVKFLINGQERETLAGHVDLTSFYDTAAVHQLAKEFE
jgi:hypothetical protein